MANTDDGTRIITRKEMEDIAAAAAKNASTEVLTRTFAILGVNFQDFEAMQEFRLDLEFAKSTRRVSQLTGKRVWTAFISTGTVAIMVALWAWAKAMFPNRVP